MDRAPLVAVALGLAALVGAHEVRDLAAAQRARWPQTVDEPYAPSPESAVYVTLGYRELAADVFLTRARVYFGGNEDTAAGLRGLIDATVTLDPSLEIAYDFGARAVGWVDGGTTQADRLWAAELLERGMRHHPESWRLPYLAGQIYVLDLEGETPEQHAAWQDHGTSLLEKAVRMPGAPRDLGDLIAFLRTRLGQRDRAVRELRELILITEPSPTRDKLIAELARMENADAEAITLELDRMRERFRAAWLRALPEATETMYILVGDPPRPYIDLADLAAGPERPPEEEPLEPVPD